MSREISGKSGVSSPFLPAGKSGVMGNPVSVRHRRGNPGRGNPVSVRHSCPGEIRCQFVILARKDEATPDYAPATGLLARPPGSGEVTLSQELRTVGLLRPHVLVGYQWSHTGLCPGCRPVITATSAASCRTPSDSLATDHCSFAPTSAPAPPAGSDVRRLFPAGYCLTPTDELAKTERGAISMSDPSTLSPEPSVIYRS